MAHSTWQNKCDSKHTVSHKLTMINLTRKDIEVMASGKESDVKEEESLEKTMKNRGRVCLFDENGGTRTDSHISKEK